MIEIIVKFCWTAYFLTKYGYDIMSVAILRALTTLQLCMKGFETQAYFYVPISDDPPKKLSGTVLTLFGGIPEPTTAFSYFSYEEDVQKVFCIIPYYRGYKVRSIISNVL